VPDLLIYADTIRSPELRHEVPVPVPDAFVYAEKDGKRYVFVGSLEVPRIEGIDGIVTVPLEDLGVVPEEHHPMTLNDVLNHNVDLIAFAARILAHKEKQALRLTMAAEAPAQRLEVEVDNFDRLDLMIGDRPLLSRNVTSGKSEITLPEVIQPGSLLIGRGYRSGNLIVSTRLAI